MSPRQLFRKRIAEGKTLWVPGAHDALSARIIESTGFEALVVSGFGVSASLLGLPDTEIYTMTENLSVVRAVCNAVKIPVMADADTGYGNAINVMRTVREFEQAGCASVSLEDQVSPKKCPAVSDQIDILPLDEAVGKIRAAVAARRDSSLVIIARTDARDIGEAVRRAKAYAEAGADVVKPISKCCGTLEDLRSFRAAVGKPVAISILGKLRSLSRAEVESAAAIATFPLMPLMTMTAALRANLLQLRETMTEGNLPVAPMPEDEFKDFIGFPQVEALERSFLAPAR